MTRTVTGLVTDMVGPGDLDEYFYDPLRSYADRKGAWVALVRTAPTRTILGTIKELVPFADAGNHTVVVVEEPHFRPDDIVAIEVYSFERGVDWYAACDTGPIRPASSEHAYPEGAI